MHACIHSSISPSIQPLTHSIFHSFINPFIHPFVTLFVTPFISPLIRLFIHSSIHPVYSPCSHHEAKLPSEAPPLPMLPDDIEDDDDNFPLITSVFSLASSDDGESTDTAESPDGNSQKLMTSSEVKTPEATSHGAAFPKVTSPKETSPGVTSIKSPEVTSPGRSNQANTSSFRVSPKSVSTVNQINAPFYVGKGKLLLPKNNEGKVKIPSQTSGMTFNKMVSIHPITTSATSTTMTTSKETTVRLTRGALKKADTAATSVQTAGSKISNTVTFGQANAGSKVSTTPTSVTSNTMVDLTKTLSFVDANTAHFRIAVPPANTVALSSLVGATDPLMQLVQRLPPTTTAVTQSQLKTVVQTPLTTSVGTSGTTVVQKTFTTPVGTSKMTVVQNPVTTTGRQPKPRHVNIAPAPLTTVNTPRFVAVPKTVSTSTSPNQIVSTSPISGNIPRVVVVPKQAGTQAPVNGGQLMYLIENKTADGKTFRFLIPTDSAKIVTKPATGTQSLTTTSRPVQSTVPATSPTQLIRIIPKPAQGAVTQASKTTTSTTLKIVPATTTTAAAAVATPNTGRPAVSNTPPAVTGNMTPPGSSSPTINMMSMTSPISEEDSINTPPTSPSLMEDSSPNEEAMDTGISPHEARIQKLKELLRQQEDAVDRLREKRKKEIDDVRATATTTKSDTNSEGGRDSPFAVPLPPKKARYDTQHKRHDTSKINTTTQTSKDGFLPNTDDNQFVKLVGLEKVVDKLKAKKILEQKVAKVSELN